MIGLNLSPRPKTQLPASAFPNQADEYFCDQCRRKVTQYLRPRQAHVWTPMGPERFICKCGEKYLTGATEWDHIGARERKRRHRDNFFLTLLLSTLLCILILSFALPIGHIFHRVHAAIVAVATLECILLAASEVTFWFSPAKSMWRTRFSRNIELYKASPK
jgi:hypothetical protein